jgi:hypothetical protein
MTIEATTSLPRASQRDVRWVLALLLFVGGGGGSDIRRRLLVVVVVIVDQVLEILRI